MLRRMTLLILALAAAYGCGGQELRVVSASPADFKGCEPGLIDVRGQGFKDGAQVWFGNDLGGQTIYISAERIIALTPPGASSGVKDLKVIAPDGKGATLLQAVKFKSCLAVTGIEPAMMLESATGAEARISGIGFMAGAKVTFGAAESPAVLVKDETYLNAKVPQLGPGTADVCVINPDAAKACLFDGFQALGAGQAMPLQAMKEAAEALGMTGVELENDMGVGFADVNQDGLLDFILSSGRGVSLHLGSREGKFTDATAGSGLDQVKNIVYGEFFGDFDNDGRPDVVVTGQPVRIFHNLGGGKFEDVSQRVGLTEYLKAWSAVFFDYDRDGLVDLYIGTMAEDDRLFHNDGGKFSRVFPDKFLKKEIAAKYSNGQASSFSAAASDYDHDGYPDIFIGIRGQPSFLYHNLQGKGFEDVTVAMGVGTAPPAAELKPVFKPNWGATWADVDNDGFLDLFLSSGPLGFDLYKNREGKGFVDVADRMGIQLSENNLMAAWGDLDNDGFLDMAVSDNLSGVRIYRNLGDGSFKEVTGELAVANAPRNSPMATVWVDVNRDGALDLYTVEYMTLNRLFLNAPYPGRHYLEVELVGKKSNSMALGALVTVTAGATVLTREATGAEGYLAGPGPILHFGLGSADKIDRLTVLWPAGDAQTLDQVQIDQILTVTEPGERKAVELPPPPPPPPAPAPGATVQPGKTVK